MSKMNCGLGRWAQARHAARHFPALAALLLTALAAGCAGKSGYGGAFATIPVPQPPAFLNGAMALLLTNAEGFRAHVVLERGAPARDTVSGELMGQGGNLLFAPGVNKNTPKKSLAGSSAFIWNVPGNRGYVLNDPMQAYAPFSPSIQFTNFTAAPSRGSAASEKIAGHPCQPTDAIVAASDGSIAAFRVWRATDLKGLPLRIVSTSSGAPLTLNLSKVHLEKLPEDLFLPPNGFRKFDSGEAMVNELAARHHNLNQRPTYRPAETEPAPGMRLPTQPQ
jgi:hypothetical protein